MTTIFYIFSAKSNLALLLKGWVLLVLFSFDHQHPLKILIIFVRHQVEFNAI